MEILFNSVWLVIPDIEYAGDGALHGGDWVGSIDRPHFEVKSSWKMSKGYKLEGQVMVPSNSKLQVQLIDNYKLESRFTNKQKQKTISLMWLKRYGSSFTLEGFAKWSNDDGSFDWIVYYDSTKT